jgi:hypothetical protein
MYKSLIAVWCLVLSGSMFAQDVSSEARESTRKELKVFTNATTTNMVAKFATGGTLTDSNIYQDAAGRIAVNSTSASKLLTLDLGSATTDGIRLSRNADATNPYLDFLMVTGANAYSYIQSGDSVGWRPLSLNPSGGSVGIGTSAPATGTILHVVGSAGQWVTVQRGTKQMYVNANWGGGSVFSQISNRASDNMGLSLSSKDTSPENLYVTPAGNVGVGTMNPQAKLDVIGSFRARAINDGTTEYPASIEWSTTGPSASTDRWIAFVGSSTGSYGVVPNAWELYEYPPAAAPVSSALRMRILKSTTAAVKSFVIDGTGNVGIGTLAPTDALTVAGNIKATGDIRADGVIYAKYQDLAEWVPSDNDLDAGTVVVLSQSAPNHVAASTHAYDTTVAGVVSAAPGIVLGIAGDEKEQIATTGRVRVKVDASSAAVRVGDLLVTSNRPGYAMKSIPVDIGGTTLHRPGTIVGKALESLSTGEGEILVLLSLQ